MSTIRWENSWNIDGGTPAATKTLGSVHTNVSLTLHPAYVSSVIYTCFPIMTPSPRPDMNSVASIFAHGGQDYMKWQRVIEFVGRHGYQLVSQTASMDWNCIGTPSPIAYYLNRNRAFGCNMYAVHP